MKWKFDKIKRDIGIRIEVNGNQLIGHFKISGETYKACLSRYLSRPYYNNTSEFVVYKLKNNRTNFFINVYEKYLTVLQTRESLLRMIKDYEMERRKNSEKDNEICN